MPSLNWFSLSRVGGGPTYYWAHNRTEAPVWLNDVFYGVFVSVAGLVAIMAVLAPPMKHKRNTLFLVTTSILVGGALVLASWLPAWQTAVDSIQAPIRFHDKRDRRLILGVHLGLDHVNITLHPAPTRNESKRSAKTASPMTPTVVTSKNLILLPRLLPRDSAQPMAKLAAGAPPPAERIAFNERIELEAGTALREQMREALERGLPVPILTVVQYLSHAEEGFRWAVDFRTAGYCTRAVLLWTLAAWAFMNVLFLVIPRYGALAMMAVGLLCLLSVVVYWSMLPTQPLVIHVGGRALRLQWGASFWTVLATGLLTCFAGLGLYLTDLARPGSLDFDLLLHEDYGAAGAQNSTGCHEVEKDPAPSAEPVAETSFKKPISLLDFSTDLSLHMDSGILAGHSFETTTDVDTTQLPEVDLELDTFGHRETCDDTFHQSAELPSFHESTVSHLSPSQLCSDSSVDSTDIEEVVHVDIIPPATSPKPATGQDDQLWSGYSDELFLSPSAKTQTQRQRRSMRKPSTGSHRDIIAKPKSP